MDFSVRPFLLERGNPSSNGQAKFHHSFLDGFQRSDPSPLSGKIHQAMVNRAFSGSCPTCPRTLIFKPCTMMFAIFAIYAWDMQVKFNYLTYATHDFHP